ncbi:MAG: virulence protein [Prevotellaceae bacterium]|nr:virulence protein [Candidatus Colivivens equi]
MNGYALSFDMDVKLLKQFYGEPYNPAYLEIKKTLEKCGFFWFQGSTYMSGTTDLTVLFNAMMTLKKIDWFCKSVRDIRGYKVEDWSDFTALIKEQ